jgi:hypothetical protein
MNDVGFIGVGQAGGNIVQLFEQKGYPVMYINTSQEDLNTLKDSKYVYHITGGEGANKDRDKAKQLVIDDYDNIAAMVDKVMDCEILFIVFSSGGGTGSGTGPMLIDLMLDENRKVGAVTILPTDEESVKTKYNSYECFRELLSLDKMASMFILDNSRADKFYINERFVNMFDNYMHIPKMYSSMKGNIDDAEIKEMLLTHGMGCVYSSDNTNIAGLTKSICDGIYAPIEGDKVKYIALAADDSISSFEGLHKAIGVSYDEFRTYTDGDCVLMLAGMNYPLSRLDEIHSDVLSGKDIIINNTTINRQELKDDFDFLRKAPNTMPRAEPKSKRDIMAKYLKR